MRKLSINTELSQTLHSAFSFLSDDASSQVHDILKGDVVGSCILHKWSEEQSVTIYNGKVEKKKRRGKNTVYVVCYWQDEDGYEDGGEDYDIPFSQMAVDFICEDLSFLWILHIFTFFCQSGIQGHPVKI